jgi:iron(III) transport system ATP-binding protein
VETAGLGFSYSGRPVLEGVTLALPAGQTSVVIGPSGSGKSTLLQLLAGLLRPDAGEIRFDGRDVAGLPPERRDIGMVFQSYALFPHLRVRDNVAFGLRTAARRAGRGEIEERVRDAAGLLGILDLLDRRPGELSGGEQQRVAVARAIAPRPALLLLDEPLSALDARLRRTVRAELAALLRRLGTTVLYVTHDQEEAMLLADHLVVLRDGRVAQAGPPLDLYRRPADAFVAAFLGEASVLPAEALAGYPPPGEPGRLVVRPEDLTLDEAGTPVRVAESRGVGPYDRAVLVTAGGTELLAHLPPGSAPAAGSTVRIAILPGRGCFLPDRPED